MAFLSLMATSNSTQKECSQNCEVWTHLDSCTLCLKTVSTSTLQKCCTQSMIISSLSNLCWDCVNLSFVFMVWNPGTSTVPIPFFFLFSPFLPSPPSFLFYPFFPFPFFLFLILSLFPFSSFLLPSFLHSSLPTLFSLLHTFICSFISLCPLLFFPIPRVLP